MRLLCKLEKFLRRLGILRRLKQGFRLLVLLEVIDLLCNVLEYHGIQGCPHLMVRELGSLAEIMGLQNEGAGPLSIRIVHYLPEDACSRGLQNVRVPDMHTGLELSRRF